MLVTYDNSLNPVGIAVTQWRVKGQLRTFVLFPFSGDVGQSYVEVDCATVDKKDLIVVAKQTPDWQSINNGFGDNSTGYKYDDEIRASLYKVWDDGAKRQMKDAQKLFLFFERLIESYGESANEFLESTQEDKYQEEVKAARLNGWDTTTIKRESLVFPYIAAEAESLTKS